jgi:hypothetical protein
MSAACLLAGCESTTGLASGDYDPSRLQRQCAGAYTPHSEVCWKAPENDGGDDQVSANSSTSQENMADIEGRNRCDPPGIIGAPGTEGTMTVTFTTTSIPGLYAPRNCGAVWIEDSLLFFVRTIELWTAERAMSLVQWNSRACHVSDTTVTAPDVVTSATLDKPATHSIKWDTKDFRGKVVPDGVYTLWMQVAVNEIFPEGPFMTIPVTKGPTPFAVKPPDMDGFKDIQITYTPTVAAPVASP